MKSSILCIILYFFIAYTSAQEYLNYKYWHKDSVLKWEDFKSIGFHNDEHAASSNCNISYYFDIKTGSIVNMASIILRAIWQTT